MQQQINADLEVLITQLSTLKGEFEKAISSGKAFMEVKMIHLQIKELSQQIENLQRKNLGSHLRVVNE